MIGSSFEGRKREAMGIYKGVNNRSQMPGVVAAILHYKIFNFYLASIKN